MGFLREGAHILISNFAIATVIRSGSPPCAKARQSDPPPAPATCVGHANPPLRPGVAAAQRPARRPGTPSIRMRALNSGSIERNLERYLSVQRPPQRADRRVLYGRQRRARASKRIITMTWIALTRESASHQPEGMSGNTCARCFASGHSASNPSTNRRKHDVTYDVEICVSCTAIMASSAKI